MEGSDEDNILKPKPTSTLFDELCDLQRSLKCDAQWNKICKFIHY